MQAIDTMECALCDNVHERRIVPVFSSGTPAMIVKRSITIRGHQTSISIEDLFWRSLQAIANRRGEALAALVATIDGARPADTNLSSAIRLFVLDDALAGAGHATQKALEPPPGEPSG